MLVVCKVVHREYVVCVVHIVNTDAMQEALFPSVTCFMFACAVMRKTRARFYYPPPPGPHWQRRGDVRIEYDMAGVVAATWVR